MGTPNKRGITVAQLIEALRDKPQDARVVYYDAEWGFIEIGGAITVTAESATREDYSYKDACVWLKDADAWKDPNG